MLHVDLGIWIFHGVHSVIVPVNTDWHGKGHNREQFVKQHKMHVLYGKNDWLEITKGGNYSGPGTTESIPVCTKFMHIGCNGIADELNPAGLRVMERQLAMKVHFGKMWSKSWWWGSSGNKKLFGQLHWRCPPSLLSCLPNNPPERCWPQEPELFCPKMHFCPGVNLNPNCVVDVALCMWSPPSTDWYMWSICAQSVVNYSAWNVRINMWSFRSLQSSESFRSHPALYVCMSPVHCGHSGLRNLRLSERGVK